jgi:hypothetical protein
VSLDGIPGIKVVMIFSGYSYKLTATVKTQIPLLGQGFEYFYGRKIPGKI